MSVFPLNIPEKINTPELLAFFQQFGLDKYLSAEEINKMTAGLAELKEASGNVAIINTIFVNNSFTKVGQIFKGNAGTQWNINGLNYTNPTDQEITIPLCAIGKERTDRIVLDTNNNFILVQGVEVTANPVAQSKPVNTLDYTFIPVNDSLVGVPTSPIVGSDVVKKSFANMFEFNGTGANSIIPLHPSGYSEIRLINAALTSVSGVDLSLMTGPNFESPYQGKPIVFWNRTGGNVTLNNEDYAIADYPLFLTQGSNLVFPHNHFVIFKWDSAGLYQVDKNFFSIDEIIGLTTALSLKADLVAGKVPSAQLPSYVDDVLEFANLADFPVSGEASKIYLALDNNLTYRWSGSTYVDLNSSKLNKVSTVDVEKVYVKNADGTQGMKPVSEFGGGSAAEFLKHKVKWTTLWLNNTNWKSPTPFDPGYYDTQYIGTYGNGTTPNDGGGALIYASWDAIPDGYYVYGVQLEVNYKADILSLASTNLQVYINRIETTAGNASNTFSNISNLVNQVVNIPLGANGRMNFIFPLTVNSLSAISLAKSFTKIWVREITSTNIYYSINFDIIYKKI